MTALQVKGVIARVFRNWIANAFFASLTITVGSQHAIAADPVARIGLIGRAQLGLSARLESIGQNDSEARFSWQLAQRPKNSKAKLDDNNAARASFVPDVPGRYVVQLTVRLRNSSDTASLDVTPAASGPLVPVNTMDMSNGTPTMYINGTAYPDLGNTSESLSPGKGFHVVIVDRNSLGPVSGVTTNTSYAANSSGISAMSTALGKLNNTSGNILVLLSLPGGVTIQSSDLSSLNTALNKIGGVVPQGWEMGKTNPNLQTCWSSNQIQCYLNNPVWQVSSTGWTGAFSVIGVPGMSFGSAWYNDAQQDPASGGALVGYLTPSIIINQNEVINSGNAYTFAFPDQYVIVDTCAPVPQGSGCVIDVNGQTYPPLNGITNGMTVVVLDRVTLAPLAYNTVTNTADLYNTIYTTNKWSSGHFFFGPYNATNPISDRVIVLLQSVGNGILSISPLGSKDYGTALLQVIDQLGGTPETFGNCMQVGNPPAFGTYPPATQLYGGYCRQSAGPGPYALVGVAGKLPWHGKGIESSPVISDTLGCTDSTCLYPGRSRGVLSRDRFGRYTPTTFDPQGTAILDLASIIYQAPQQWPNADSCAIQWIYEGLQQQGGINNPSQPLIRSSYVTDPTNLIWNYNTTVAYPNPLPAGYCPADNPFPDSDTYNSIMQELQVEFRWVQHTTAFLNSIATVFGSTQSGSTTQVASIAGDIYNTIKPPTENTSVPWQSIADLSFAIIGTAEPETQGVLGIMAASITIGTDATSQSPTSNPTKQFIAQTNQVATTLDRQTKAYLWTLTNVLRPILYSDYGKLSIVGQNVFTQAWPWNSSIAQIAASAVSATTTQAVYSALLPSAWPMVELKPDFITQFQSADLTKFICWHPDDGSTQYQNDAFGHALIQNQLLSLFQLQLTHSGTNSLETANYEAWTWADYDIYSSFTARPTDTTFYNALFLSPVDAAGAGAYPPAWYRSTYNPPDFVRCGSTAVYSSTEQHAPKALSPTAAGYTLN